MISSDHKDIIKFLCQKLDPVHKRKVFFQPIGQSKIPIITLQTYFDKTPINCTISIHNKNPQKIVLFLTPCHDIKIKRLDEINLVAQFTHQIKESTKAQLIQLSQLNIKFNSIKDTSFKTSDYFLAAVDISSIFPGLANEFVHKQTSYVISGLILFKRNQTLSSGKSISDILQGSQTAKRVNKLIAIKQLSPVFSDHIYHGKPQKATEQSTKKAKQIHHSMNDIKIDETNFELTIVQDQVTPADRLRKTVLQRSKPHHINQAMVETFQKNFSQKIKYFQQHATPKAKLDTPQTPSIHRQQLNALINKWFDLIKKQH